MPSDSNAVGFKYKFTWRCMPPTTLTEPTPRTFSKRFSSTWLPQVVSSCGERLPSVEVMATLKMGALAGSNLDTRGSFTSSRNSGRMSATFSRTSSAALRPSTLRLNSAITTDAPS